jgi:hypothetical protein
VDNARDRHAREWTILGFVGYLFVVVRRLTPAPANGLPV